MLKKYLTHLLFTILCCSTVACDTSQQGSTHSIQFEIEETKLSAEEKSQAVANIQKRLELLGAENVTVNEQEGQQLTYRYQGNIEPKSMEQYFSVAGKLEFFEVCKEKSRLQTYLLETFKSQLTTDHNEMTREEQIERVYDFLGIQNTNANYGADYPAFAVVSKENREKVHSLLVQQPPFNRIKFLLGRTNTNGHSEVYAVYLNSENKAPLDGSFVQKASVQTSTYDDSYLVNIRKNEEGAKIWEQLTENAYKTIGNIAVVIDDTVYSSPTVSNGAIIGGRSQISAKLTKEEATTLAAALNTGAIPKLKIIKMTASQEANATK